jgi:hypothetical protein
MREYRVGALGRARVWFKDIPADFSPTRRIETAAAAALKNASRKKVAVEAFIPRGAFAEYALLGGSWNPGRFQFTRVAVSVSNESGPAFAGHLAGRVDEVRIGLPEEYGEGVLDTLASHAGALGRGRLLISSAAHGRIGSSVTAFSRVATVLLKLFELEDHGDDAAALVARLL